MLQYKYIFQIKYTEAILSNSTRKLLWFEISKMLIAVKNKFIVLFIVILDTLSFPIGIIDVLLQWKSARNQFRYLPTLAPDYGTAGTKSK